MMHSKLHKLTILIHKLINKEGNRILPVHCSGSGADMQPQCRSVHECVRASSWRHWPALVPVAPQNKTEKCIKVLNNYCEIYDSEYGISLEKSGKSMYCLHTLQERIKDCVSMQEQSTLKFNILFYRIFYLFSHKVIYNKEVKLQQFVVSIIAFSF